MDKLSYALGMSLAGNLIASGVRELDIDDFAAGVKAVIKGGDKAMTFEQAKAEVTRFFTELEQQAGKMNAEAGRKFLEENKKQEGVKVTKSGLQYLVVKQGNGPIAGHNDAVTVHYTGRLIDGTVFDSSVERGEPATFGVGQVIAGWTEALTMMPEGSAWRLFIPAELAYGSHGTGPIQPNSTLIFDVQLIKVNSKH